MWHKVPYTEFQIVPDHHFPQGQTVLRPVLRLDLVAGDARFPCYAIVDSGADHCTFPLSFAKALGFDLLAKQPGEIGGVGNSRVEVFYWDVEIEFPGVTKYPAYVGFTNGLEDQGFGLLGQTGFFDRFKTTFDHPSKFFHVEIP